MIPLSCTGRIPSKRRDPRVARSRKTESPINGYSNLDAKKAQEGKIWREKYRILTSDPILDRPILLEPYHGS